MKPRPCIIGLDEPEVRELQEYSGESFIEPYFEGEAVRVVIIGDQHWQISLAGDDWLKSIHHDDASIMPVDERLLLDTRRIAEGFGLEIVANDYIVTPDGEPQLLEVHHIPNVTRFPEIWIAYRDFVLQWLRKSVCTP